MRNLESKVQKKILGLVWKYLGIKGSKLVTPGDTGFPDLLFWIPGGCPFLIEVKRPGEEARVKQAYVHNYLRELGYQVEVHDDPISAFQAVIDAVAATRLPKESREVLARARSCCALLRSRAR